MKKETKTFSVRLDTEMLDKIKTRAESERRSINFIITEILEESFSKDESIVKINNLVFKDIEKYCKKSNMPIQQLIEMMWKAYSRTFRK